MGVAWISSTSKFVGGVVGMSVFRGVSSLVSAVMSGVHVVVVSAS